MVWKCVLGTFSGAPLSLRSIYEGVARPPPPRFPTTTSLIRPNEVPYLAVVEFETVEQGVDDVVDGLLKNGFWVVLVRRPAAHLLRYKTYVQRQTAVRQRLLDCRQLTSGQRPAGSVQSLSHNAHAEIRAQWRDTDEVFGTENNAANANKYVRLRRLTYIHTCRSYVYTPSDFTNGASLAWRLRRRISTVMFTCGWAWPALWSIHPILGF